MSDATNVWDDVPDWGGIGALRLVRSSSNALGASVSMIVDGKHTYHRAADAVEHAGPEYTSGRRDDGVDRLVVTAQLERPGLEPAGVETRGSSGGAADEEAQA